MNLLEKQLAPMARIVVTASCLGTQIAVELGEDMGVSEN